MPVYVTEFIALFVSRATEITCSLKEKGSIGTNLRFIKKILIYFQ